MSTSKLHTESSENGYLLAHNDLEKIVALLLWMAQGCHSNIQRNDIHHAALEVIIEHVKPGRDGTLGLLHPASVAKLSELIDIMMTDKTGALKDPNATLIFMRRVARVREEVLATSIDNATERVESSAGPALTLKAPTCPPRLTPKAPTVPPPERSARGHATERPGPETAAKSSRCITCCWCSGVLEGNYHDYKCRDCGRYGHKECGRYLPWGSNPPKPPGWVCWCCEAPESEDDEQAILRRRVEIDSELTVPPPERSARGHATERPGPETRRRVPGKGAQASGRDRRASSRSKSPRRDPRREAASSARGPSRDRRDRRGERGAERAGPGLTPKAPTVPPPQAAMQARMAAMQAMPKTPCLAASYPHSQPPLNHEPFWQGWLHLIERWDGGADSLKAAKKEFVTTRDIVYAYVVNQCAETMATKRGCKSWDWASALNGDGDSVHLCLVWATGESSADQETPLGHPFPWEGWWPCAVIATDSMIWLFYCPPMAWARQKAWHVHQSRLLVHDCLRNLRQRCRSHAAQLVKKLEDEVSKEPEEPETEPEQASREARCMDQCMLPGPRHATEQLAKHQVAVETWSPRTHVEARICPGDGIEVDWKQPDAEGGFWAWGLVHHASAAPKWGYFPLSCIPPPLHAKMVFVEEHHV